MSSTSKITSFFIRCPNLDILHRWFNAGQSSKSSKAVIQFGQSLHASISTLDDRSDTMMLRIRNTLPGKTVKIMFLQNSSILGIQCAKISI